MDRRNFIGALGTIGVTVLAGCSDPDRPTEEEIEYYTKVHAWLYEGESLGSRSGDENWIVTVESINDDDTIDATAEKTIFDETGQNKEGSSNRFEFERYDVEPMSQITIERDFRILYLKRHEDQVLIALSIADESDLLTLLESEHDMGDLKP